MTHPAELPLTLAEWRRAYVEQGASPQALIATLTARHEADDVAWIHRCAPAFITAQLQRLADTSPGSLPLWGVPFAVKDNIDVAGLPTTAACPEFAYQAQTSATVVQRLMDAGAVLVGKTNLDQFATGLVGTRSPYGEVPNTFDPAYVSGGSSSGSASVVARGLVPFALGTDTAGSGRVPAGFNNLVGLKPSPGAVPMAGVLPACRTLDVVSIFALTVADAAQVMAVMEGATADEPHFQSPVPRPAWLGAAGRALKIGVPLQPGCDEALGYAEAFEQAVVRLSTLKDPLGGEMAVEVVPIDFTPMFEVARLLYDGPWVAERQAVVQDLMAASPDAFDATVLRVIAAAERYNAVDTFRARYALETLRARLAPLWRQVDVLMVPSSPTCPTRAAVAAEPVLRNSELGRYTNFVNLLGWSALALPSGFTKAGLPFGVTVIAPGGADAALAAFGLQWEAAHKLPLGAHLRAVHRVDRPPQAMPTAGATMALAVVGAHLSGMPLHGQLSERGCRLLARTHTASRYRLHALPGTVPPKPGLVRVVDADAGAGAESAGRAIEIEVYEMPLAAVGSFLALIPPPLGLGSVELADGRWVKGFICEPAALVGAPDISEHGGWRAYMAAVKSGVA